VNQQEFKSVVRSGYDTLALRGDSWTAPVNRPDKAKYARIFMDSVRPGGRVLDLGSGHGGTTGQKLAGRFRLVCVDLSRGQLGLAQSTGLNASLVHGDMASVQFRQESFDGVVAFFSLIHVPGVEQAALLQSIFSWLRPGGILVATMGSSAVDVDHDEDFMGVPMCWSSLGTEANEAMVCDAGFRLDTAAEETAIEFGSPVTFLWVVATKPTPSDPAAT
jgi:SAM-dependent methyltransferase